MTSLLSLQQQFIQVLQGADPDDFSQQIVDQGAVSRETRLGIYSNAYFMRLKESIETDHEQLGFYMGDALFDQMAEDYVQQFPSQQTSLRHFSDQLPFFLSHYKPFSDYPVLAELARFERFLLIAFDAADAKGEQIKSLADIPVESWPGLCFRLHPSVQLFQSNWNVVQIWQALKQQLAPSEPEEKVQNWLIWRNGERLTEFVSLNSVELCMLEAMMQGQCYADICEKLVEFLDIEMISECSLQVLINWLELGVIRSLIVK